MGSLRRSLKRKFERENRKNDMRAVWNKLENSSEYVYRRLAEEQRTHMIDLDTHVGSASSLIAAQALNRRFVGCELDRYYYQQAMKRFRQESAQLTMFNLFREI